MFGGIWLLVGTVITIAFTIGGGPVWNDLVLDRRGLATDATPTAIEPTGSRVNGRAVFRIAYTFTDKDGVARTGSSGHDERRAARQRRASANVCPIEYDPQAPLLSRVAGERASFFGWFILLPLGFAVVGAIVASRGLRRAAARQADVRPRPRDPRRRDQRRAHQHARQPAARDARRVQRSR